MSRIDDGAYSLEEDRVFYKDFLNSLRENYSGFLLYFRVQLIFLSIGVILSFILSLVIFSYDGLLGFLQASILTVNVLMFSWVAALLGRFFSLQFNRVNHEYSYLISYREASMKKSDEILNNAKKRVPNIISSIKIGGSVSGNVSSVAGDKNTISQNQQADNKEIKEAIALLIAYTSESKNLEAERAAENLRSEAEKDDKDRTKIFSLWTNIVGLLPAVGNVVSIVNGVQKLFL